MRRNFFENGNGNYHFGLFHLLSSFLEIVIISELQNVETKQECADICHLTPKCSWFSHSEDEKTCFAMESCFKADTDISNYYSGTVTLI